MGIAALYPHPPQQPQPVNPLALAPTIMQLQDFASRRAVGNALQGAVGPDGNMDYNAASAAIAADPNAALHAGEGLQTIQAIRGQNIENATHQLGLFVNQNQAAAEILAPYANEKNISDDDAQSVRQKLALAGVPAAIIGNIPDGQHLLRAAQIGQRYIAGAANMNRVNAVDAAGNPITIPVGAAPTGAGLAQPGATAGAPLPPPIRPPAVRPAPGATPVVSPGGPPTAAAGPSPGAAPAAPPPAGALPSGLGPQSSADFTEYANDQAKSAAMMAGLRPLTQAWPIIKALSDDNFGPASENYNRIRALANEFNIPWNPDATVMRQELGKLLNRYVTQFPHSDRSDAALAQVAKSNADPSQMLKPTVLNLVRQQIGYDRIDAATPNMAAQRSDVPVPQFDYKNWKTQNYLPSTDLRGATWDLADPGERESLAKTLKGPERDRVRYSKRAAQSVGMTTPGQ